MRRKRDLIGQSMLTWYIEELEREIKIVRYITIAEIIIFIIIILVII